MTYHTGPTALQSIATTESRIAYAMTVTPEGPTFMELIKTDGCFVIREHDLAGVLGGVEPSICVLGAAYSASHIAAMWERLAGDATTAYELERGRL